MTAAPFDLVLRAITIPESASPPRGPHTDPHREESPARPKALREREIDHRCRPRPDRVFAMIML
jgi:hypothetical protein